MLRPILAALGALLAAAFLVTPAEATGDRQGRGHHHHHRHHHHGTLFYGAGFYGPYAGYCGAACTGRIYVPALVEGETCTRYYLREGGAMRPLGFACKRMDGLWDMFPDPLPPSGDTGFGSIAPIE